jgi:hypothetical protein
VEYAKQSCELSGWKRWAEITTIAATYTAARDLEQAIKCQNQALGFSEFAKQYGEGAQQWLKLYKQKPPLGSNEFARHKCVSVRASHRYPALDAFPLWKPVAVF